MKTLQTLKPVTTTLLVALIAFTVACGYSSKAMPPVAGAMPTIAALDPTSANAGGAAFTLTINGTNFGSKAVANLNGAAQTSNTMFVSASQLTVVVPASAIATAGSVTVTVTNPGTPGGGLYGGGGTLPETSSPTTFTVN